jgi:hypothetical protein
MIRHDELLAALIRMRADGRVRNSDVQRWLGLESSRVADIFNGRRRVQLDEAATLVERIGMDKPRNKCVLSKQAAAMFVTHAIKSAGVAVPDDQVDALARDMVEFVEIASAGPSLKKLHGFFLGRLRSGGTKK